MFKSIKSFFNNKEVETTFQTNDFHVKEITPTVASLSGKFGVKYAPSIAEDGKFVKLDTHTLSEYPITGMGKYAVLTYNVNPLEIASTVNISGVNIDEPVEIEYPDTTYNMSSSYIANTVHTVTFPAVVDHIELYVKSGSTYLVLNDGVSHTLATLSAQGIFLQSGAYYTNDYVTTSIKFGSTATVDLRIFGNYRS